METVSTATEHPVSPLNGQPVPQTPWAKGVSGNPGGQPQGKAFRKRLRAYIERPDIWAELEARILRDLKGDGAGAFALKALAYVYGEPRVSVEIDLRDQCERRAPQLGVTPDELLAEVSRMAELN